MMDLASGDSRIRFSSGIGGISKLIMRLSCQVEIPDALKILWRSFTLASLPALLARRMMISVLWT